MGCALRKSTNVVVFKSDVYKLGIEIILANQPRLLVVKHTVITGPQRLSLNLPASPWLPNPPTMYLSRLYFPGKMIVLQTERIAQVHCINKLAGGTAPTLLPTWLLGHVPLTDNDIFWWVTCADELRASHFKAGTGCFKYF